MKDVDLVFKLAARVVDAAEKDANAKEHEAWDGRAIGKLEKELDARRKEAVEQLKADRLLRAAGALAALALSRRETRAPCRVW